MGIAGGEISASLISLWQGALVRGALILALSAGAITACVRGGRKHRIVAIAVISLIAVFDLAESGSRFVVPIDYSFKKAPNLAAEALIKNGIDPAGATYSYLLLTQQLMHPSVPFLDTLGNYGMSSADPMQGDGPDSPRVKIFQAFGQNNFMRRLEFQGTQALFARVDVAADLVRRGEAKVVTALDFDQRMLFTAPRDPRNPNVVLLRPTNALPTAAVFHSWTTTGNMVELAASRDFDFANTATVEFEWYEFGGRISSRHRSPATWVESPLDNGGRRAVISIDVEEEGLLVFAPVSFGSSMKLRATVNGKRTPVVTANITRRGVLVPAGKSTIIIQPATSALSAAFAIVFAVLFMWLITLYCRTR